MDWAADALLYSAYDRVVAEIEVERPFLTQRLARRGSKDIKTRYLIRNEGPRLLFVVRLHSPSLEVFRFRKRVIAANGDSLVVLTSELAFDAIPRAFGLVAQQIEQILPDLGDDIRHVTSLVRQVFDEIDTNGCSAHPDLQLTCLAGVEDLQATLLVNNVEEENDTAGMLADDLDNIQQLITDACLGLPPLLVVLPPQQAITPSFSPSVSAGPYRTGDRAEVRHPRFIVDHFSSDVQTTRWPEDIPTPTPRPWFDGWTPNAEAGQNRQAAAANGRMKTAAQVVLNTLLNFLFWAGWFVYRTTYLLALAVWLLISLFWWAFLAMTFPKTIVVDRPAAARTYHARFTAPHGFIMEEPRWPRLYRVARPISKRTPHDEGWRFDRALLPNLVGAWPKLRMPSFDPVILEKPDGQSLIRRDAEHLEVVFPERVIEDWMKLSFKELGGFGERWNRAAGGMFGFVAGSKWHLFPLQRALAMTSKFWIRIRTRLPISSSVYPTWLLYIGAATAWTLSVADWQGAVDRLHSNQVLIAGFLAFAGVLLTQSLSSLQGAAKAITAFRFAWPVAALAMLYFMLLAGEPSPS